MIYTILHDLTIRFIVFAVFRFYTHTHTHTHTHTQRKHTKPKQFALKTTSCIKNTYNFVGKIRNLSLEDDCVLVTF